jgi:hypothetical protein
MLAVAVEPSEKVAVRVKVEPGAKRPAASAAKRVTVAPSGRRKLTEPSGALRRALVGEAAHPAHTAVEVSSGNSGASAQRKGARD